MFGPLLAILAGVMSQKMQQAEAKKQAAADMRMQFARSIDPQMPTYGYQAAKFGAAQDANSGAMVAQLLPMFMNAFGSEAPKPGPSLAQDPGINGAFNALDSRRSSLLGQQMTQQALNRFSNW